MTLQDQREAARQFYNNWKGKGEEKQYSQKFWLDLLQNVYGVSDPYRYIDFEKTVHYSDGEKKITDRFADGYIAETKVLIEQKSANIDLGAPQSGHGGKTPYQQAKEYNDNFKSSDKVDWIILCNFKEFWIYNLDDDDIKPIKISFEELPTKLSMLNFLVKKEVKKITDEMEVSKQAGDIIGAIYEEFLKQYKNPDDPENLKSLNKLCVRLVFCLYAEDAGLFVQKNLFHDYLVRFDAKRARKELARLFEVLNQRAEDRDKYLEEDDEILAMFPYVNGGLFDEKIEIPPLTDKLMELILEDASEKFDWSVISPTIFGAIFESTLNPETRRKGGMHYTSIENIHKVIDPLFLNRLYREFDFIKKKSNAGGARTKALNAFRDKLASLVFLDPACGSGNFLTESFISLRRLENEVLKELHLLKGGQNVMSIIPENEVYNLKNISKPKISISQFYGIEINDFAVSVAKTALWIAEAQMMQETARITKISDAFLPLKTNAYIVEGNALRIDWNDVISNDKVSYIMGNPPFYGARKMEPDQKEDIYRIFDGVDKNGDIDYVACWFKKSASYMDGKNIRAALVATNSITQGEQVAPIWNTLFKQGVHINFAYKTFRWDSESNIKAHVHCVIIGFSVTHNSEHKIIYEEDTEKPVKRINGYLYDADDLAAISRNTPLCDVPVIGMGNQPIDNGLYLFTAEEKEEFIAKEPQSAQFFHEWYGARELIKGVPRYCLWLGDCTPKQLRSMPECMKRVKEVKAYRSSRKRAATKKLAEFPTRFQTENMPKTNYIVIPEVSSEKRKYLPIGFMTPDVLCSNKLRLMPDASLYHFGVLTSNVHMAWVEAVAGRLETRYDYSIDIVYNTFPWPEPTEAQKKRIEQTAQGILDARAMFPNDSYEDLYNPDYMPRELLKAHQANDKAVMAAYKLEVEKTSKAKCIAHLFKLYKELIEKEKQ